MKRVSFLRSIRGRLAGIVVLRTSYHAVILFLQRVRLHLKIPERTRHVATINRIGFLVHTPELLNHFGCVLDLMPEGSFEVLVCGEDEGIREITSRAARWNCKIVTTAETLESNTKYRYLVSNHPLSLGYKPLIKQLALKNIRFMYAAGKSGHNLAAWNQLYDLILCFGPYHAKAFAHCSDAVILQIGYPRFDRYFNDKADKHELQQRFNCDASKKTVVWLPTWKNLSSVGLFDREISNLTANYNVVVKLHPLMLGSEPDRVKALEKFSFTHLITDATDNLPLYWLADYLLCDYGGPPLAGIYTDKNILLLNVPEAEKDELTGEDSPDIAIREYIENVNPEDNRIAELLADTSLWEAQKSARQILRKKYFAPYFGRSSRVAVSALLNLNKIIR